MVVDALRVGNYGDFEVSEGPLRGGQFAWRDDRLYHLPVSWLHPYERWGQAAETVVPPETHSACVECHNTWVAHVPGTVNQFRRDDMHLGVTCERCHGPGREHAEYHRAHPDAPAFCAACW